MALRSIGSRLPLVQPIVKSLPKRVELFYRSPQWRALVKSIKRTRGSYCVRCGVGGRLIADHIIERKDGGADLDPRNVELLCAAVCHPHKTAQARARRVGM